MVSGLGKFRFLNAVPVCVSRKRRVAIPAPPADDETPTNTSQAKMFIMKSPALIVVALLSIHEALGFLSRTPSHQHRYQQEYQEQVLRPGPASPTTQQQEVGSKSASRSARQQRRPFWMASGVRQASTTSLCAARIIISGAPASGKGTQCEKIKEMFGVVHLSTGDMLRAAVAAGTDVGKEAKSYMDSGKLVPDSTIIGVVKDRLAAEDCQSKGWLLDGFPRTQAQAKALEEVGITADCFLFLDVPDEVLVTRVVGRRTDPITGKIYHLTFSPPPADDVELMQRLVQRSDDTEEKVKVRLEQFHANVEAVRDSYTDISVSINGNQPPDVVSKQIMEAIHAKLSKNKVEA